MVGTGSQTAKSRSILFEALSAEDARALRSRGTAVHYPGKRQICAAGSTDQTMFLIETGRVEVSLTSVDGRRSILAQLGPGDVVGEMAALDGQPRSADATAAGDVTGVLLARAEVMGFLRDYPVAALHVIETLCQRLRRTNERLATQVMTDGPTRLAALLQQLFDDWGKPDNTGALRLAKSFSQSDLGDMAGLTRETVNRQIRAWEAEGVLGREQGKLQLKNAARLDELAAGSA